MQVLTSDGEFIGTVEDMTHDGMVVRRVVGDERAMVPERWIHHVDREVHLDRTGAEVTAGWQAMAFQSTSARKDVPAQTTRPAQQRTLLIVAVVAVVVLILLMMLV